MKVLIVLNPFQFQKLFDLVNVNVLSAIMVSKACVLKEIILFVVSQFPWLLTIKNREFD